MSKRGTVTTPPRRTLTIWDTTDRRVMNVIPPRERLAESTSNLLIATSRGPLQGESDPQFPLGETPAIHDSKPVQ
jgi:hypothetical protein